MPTTTSRASMPDASAVVAERLGRVDVTRPGLRVGVDHERVDLPLRGHARTASAAHSRCRRTAGRDTARTASSSRWRGEIASGVRPSCSQATAPGFEAAVPAKKPTISYCGSVAAVTRASAADASRGVRPGTPATVPPLHRARHVEREQQPLAGRLDVAERRVERGVEGVDDLAHRVPLAAAADAAARRVRAERGEHGDRVHARTAETLRVAELRDHLRGAVRARREHADSRHRRQVADQRRHRHVVEQRLPDLGRGQVLRLERLARQAVLADERRGLPRRRRRLGADEALDEARQTVGLAAADDPLEQTSVLGRDVERRVAGADATRRVREPEQVAVRDALAPAVLDRLIGERVHRLRRVPAADRAAQRAAPAAEALDEQARTGTGACPCGPPAAAPRAPPAASPSSPRPAASASAKSAGSFFGARPSRSTRGRSRPPRAHRPRGRTPPRPLRSLASASTRTRSSEPPSEPSTRKRRSRAQMSTAQAKPPAEFACLARQRCPLRHAARAVTLQVRHCAPPFVE